MKNWKGKCSLCHKKFGTEQAFRNHAASFHKSKPAQFVLRTTEQDRELREWEYYHLARGWPI